MRGSTIRAVARDLDRSDTECLAFEEAYKGKLAALADGPQAGPALAAAVKRYEALDDLLGRIISYAGLVHAGDTVDPARAKFYGDVQDRITAASTHLLFFVLELNRLDDAKLEAAMADPALAHYRPWLEDIRKEKPLPARGPRRAAVPREIGDRPFGLEPAVRRDHRGACASRSATKSLAIEPTLNLMQDADPKNAQGGRARRWPRPSRTICGCSR